MTAGRDLAALQADNDRLLAEIVALQRDYNAVVRENAELLGEQCEWLAMEMERLEGEEW
jgi:hypothetical protein